MKYRPSIYGKKLPDSDLTQLKESPLTTAQAVVHANLRCSKSLGNPSDAMQSHFITSDCIKTISFIPIASLVFALQL